MARVAKQQSKRKDAAAENVPLLPLDAKTFRDRLARWYRKNARVLPWRGIRDPYATWLSEIMLQQTRVAAVIDRYIAFLERFPTIAALAESDEESVLALWSGLGYYRRARLLHRGAQFVIRELNGKLPRTSIQLRTLPGVGEYTAAAIASIAFREPIAVFDGNVERVLLRVLGREESKESKARTALIHVAQQLMPRAAKGPRNQPGDHNQAMMELGATICLPRGPLCLQCPVMEFCRTRGEHPTAARDKPRSRTVAHLLALRKRGVTTEVLLERRPEDASLMPNMLELPPLPLDAVADREPVLRIRHAITNTSYYVQIHTASAMGARPRTIEESDPEAAHSSLDLRDSGGDDAFTEPPDQPGVDNALMRAIPASTEMLTWCATSKLSSQPLTGLARKALQRLGVMALQKPRITPPSA